MSKVATTVALAVNESTTKGSYDWLRIKKSTALSISYNAETEDFDYISDEVKTTEIQSYAPTLEQDISILPNEPDYQFFNEMRKNLPTGADAHREFLTVYLNDKQTGGSFYAEVQDAVVSFTDYNATDGKLDISIAFCGTRTKGTATKSGDELTFTKTGE